MDSIPRKAFQKWGKQSGLKRRALSKKKRSEIASKGWKTRRKNGRT